MSHRLLTASVALNLVFCALFLGGWLGANLETSFNPTIDRPILSKTSNVHPLASVIGSVDLGDRVFVAPFASIRGDEGQDIHIGHDSNVQDGVVVHGLETFESGKEVSENEVEVDRRKYSVHIGQRVSLAHQSQVHGPARVGDDTFIGMQALVFRSEVGDHVVVEPGAKIIGVTIASNRYVPTMAVITKQSDADALPVITDQYPYRSLNHAIVHVNTQFADPQTAHRLSRQRIVAPPIATLTLPNP
ncbi:MAG: carbonic anhydrase [Nitrospira sp.]|nr:carbonic anhydrase [Nitrospira sp.]